MSSALRSALHRHWREWRGAIAFILFVVIPIKSSFADWNWVPSGSMNPTILEGDLVFVNKLAYDLRVPLTLKRLDRWADPQRGDIVVLFSPEDETRLVKRVIGVPGDEIEMRQNRLLLNGRSIAYAPLSDPAIHSMPEPLKSRSAFAQEQLPDRAHAVMATPELPARARSFSKIVVPEGKYFIMGDNRDNSHDSRAFGFADRESIIGEARAVLLSFDILDKYQPRFERFFTALQ
ncbi:signal peptidase I [Pelagicoccus sp. SDUM812003]|uniref:signal peptidase I n=1 Tax=Pelagicoccus sp. SDUM812003 TaxID=3041267 RepID=UPI0028100B06|nr:signal peptidase I [Pelagicoccus sp. SDUM812003]MDQ8202489.1 signal peptidase I [Pelagicoccus sp. SDUM812003]